MSALLKVLTGAAGLAAAVGFASPAAAQYYPGSNYGYNNGGGVVGAIVNSVLGGGYNNGYGYNNYGGGDRYAVDQCSRAVQARLGGGGYGGGFGGGGYGGGGYGGGGYGSYGGHHGYNGYSNYGGGRIVGITQVERKNSGIRVRGVATSGNRAGSGGYGYNGYGNGAADLRFSCKVDYRGRITDVDLDRRDAYYGGNGYYRGY